MEGLERITKTQEEEKAELLQGAEQQENELGILRHKLALSTEAQLCKCNKYSAPTMMSPSSFVSDASKVGTRRTVFEALSSREQSVGRSEGQTT